ncbi:MAG: hypothetical protein KAR40_02500, partial [Candidatus Sabulitectum sp.]|nr:hypothetical protein [Candidatus Sabulitectum sp.]
VTGSPTSMAGMYIEKVGSSELERIPKPRELSRQLLETLNIELPPAIAMSNLDVATKKKLNKRKLNS